MKLKKTAIAIAISLACGSAWAFGGGDASASARANQSQGQGQHQGQSSWNSNKNRNSNWNSSSSYSGAYSGSSSKSKSGVYGSGNASQGQVQGNVGLGSGNSTSYTDNSVVIEEGDPKQDIPAYAPDATAAPATAPCIKTWAGSGGGLGLFSIGASGYVKDHGCAFGEVARRADAQGNKEVAEEALQLMFAIVKKESGIDSVEDVESNPRYSSVAKSQVVVVDEDDGFAWQRNIQ